MVFARYAAGDAFLAWPALVTVKVEFSVVCFCPWRPVAAGRALRGPSVFHEHAGGFPCPSNKTATADRLSAFAPAIGAVVWKVALWPHDLAATRRGRVGAASALAGQPLD